MFKIISIAALLLCAGPAWTDEIRPGVYRTPDERFENLPGHPLNVEFMRNNPLP